MLSVIPQAIVIPAATRYPGLTLRAWAKVSNNGTVATVLASSGGVTATRVGAGQINLTVPAMPDTNILSDFACLSGDKNFSMNITASSTTVIYAQTTYAGSMNDTGLFYVGIYG